MQIPPRILRRQLMELDPSLCELTPRETERQDRILRIALPLFVEFGRHALTFSALAQAMRMATSTLRKHFTCLDALLAEILSQHLLSVARACGQVPHNAPDRAKTLRAAYLAATRTPEGEFTEAHTLFVQQRQTLPPDELERLEDIYGTLGELLGGPSSRETLAFLDNPNLEAARIEILLATYATSSPQTATNPLQPHHRHAAVVPPQQVNPAVERQAGTILDYPAPTPPRPQETPLPLPLDTATLTACLRMTSIPPPPTLARPSLARSA